MGDARQPLHGVRVLDFTQMGPGPFATAILATWGADVISIVRPLEVEAMLGGDHFGTGKRRLELNLKSAAGSHLARTLARTADVVMEGFRPGVMERLGLGPTDLRREHEELIYLRLTGYGQTGPYAQRAGHDINYLALSGALSVIGRGEPAPPMAMLGDFAGGGLTAIVGILLALRERDRTDVGTVIDAAIVDGVAQLFYSTAIQGASSSRRRLLDGTAPFYTTYCCADGRRISVGALESRFFTRLLELLEIEDPDFVIRQYDEQMWPTMRTALTSRFVTKSRDEWTKILGEADTCTAPVIEPDEVTEHPHLAARETYSTDDGIRVGRAPRLENVPQVDLYPSATPSATTAILTALGLTAAEIDDLRSTGVVADPS
jgi:alpha-methylacyl-CoA racemase